MTADDAPDNLNEAERLMGRALESSRYYSAAQTEIAKALALIEIGRTLRDIRDEMHGWDTYGLVVKKHVY